MTQDEIIEMAREVGLNVDGDYFSDAIYKAVLVRFFNLARAKEREACAKVCDEYDVKYDVNTCDTAEGIALEIRARGQA